MVVIPAGSFTMGSPPAEPGHQLNEAPQHNRVAVIVRNCTNLEGPNAAEHGSVLDTERGEGVPCTASEAPFRLQTCHSRTNMEPNVLTGPPGWIVQA
jgi:hypothetical protein